MSYRKTILTAALLLILAVTAAGAGTLPRVWHRTAEIDGLPDASHKATTLGEIEDEAKASAEEPTPSA